MPQGRDDELIAHLLTEFFVSDAFLLQRPCRGHPIPKFGADLFLDQFVNDAFGQVVPGGLKLVQDQSPPEQLIEFRAAQFVQLGLEHLGLAAILLGQPGGGVGDRDIDFISRNHRVMDHCADAVGRVSSDNGKRPRNYYSGQDGRQKSHLN